MTNAAQGLNSFAKDSKIGAQFHLNCDPGAVAFQGRSAYISNDC
jgi:hypothetical protein